jgi:hypothetical protein
MEKYVLLNQKALESTKKFEKRLNEVCQKGWKPVSIGSGAGGTIILLEKSDKYDTY